MASSAPGTEPDRSVRGSGLTFRLVAEEISCRHVHGCRGVERYAQRISTLLHDADLLA